MARLITGVAGCGNMGLPMARRLLQAGHEVRGFDIRPLAEFGEFASCMTKDAKSFAGECDVLISVVRDQEQTDALCFRDQSIFSMRTCPSVLVVSSTLSPRYIRDLRRRLPGGVALVDAPMSGAPHGAETGQLTFMCGGNRSEVDRLMPLFQAMGRHVHYLGNLGAGMTAKVLNNYVAACSTVAVRRTYRMADALGFDRDVLREVMSRSSGSTWFGDKYPLISWSREGYTSDNTMGILEKDVLSALDAVRDLGIEEDALDEAILASLRALEPDQC